MKRKRNGRIDNRSITVYEKEIIRAFLQERLDDFETAKERSRQMCKISPDDPALAKLLVYNTNAVSAMMHIMAILAGSNRGTPEPVVSDGMGERCSEDIHSGRTTRDEKEG